MDTKDLERLTCRIKLLIIIKTFTVSIFIDVLRPQKLKILSRKFLARLLERNTGREFWREILLAYKLLLMFNFAHRKKKTQKKKNQTSEKRKQKKNISPRRVQNGIIYPGRQRKKKKVLWPIDQFRSILFYEKWDVFGEKHWEKTFLVFLSWSHVTGSIFFCSFYFLLQEGFLNIVISIHFFPGLIN